MEIEKTVNDIKERLDDVAEDLNGKEVSHSEAWTKTIKKTLADLGHEKDYGVAAKGIIEADYKEWLCNLIWWRYKNNDFNDMAGIDLAVESKWNPGWHKERGVQRALEYENSFLKLVYTKAKLKLFIFGAHDEADYEKRLERFKELADMCEDRSGDKYLFSCTIRVDGEKFRHEYYEVSE